MTEHVKKDYELAIEAYVEAEKEYRKLEEDFLSGEVAADLAGRVVEEGQDRPWVKSQIQAYVDLLKNKLEDMNVKLNEAKNALRQAVVLSPTQERGPDGAASSRTYGPLTASSVTHRYFDPNDLIKLSERYGVLGRLLSLTNFDKNGKEYKLVKQTWEIDYDNVYKWLKEQGLKPVIDGSYGEKEGTPRISGAKALAFMGQKIDK